MDDLVFMPQEQEFSLKASRSGLESQFLKGLGKSINPSKRIFESESRRSGS